MGAAAVHHGHGRRHVLMFPLPFQGHINPMFRLASVLHSRGFAITIFHTHFNAPDPVRHPDYRFVPVPDGISGPAPVTIEDGFAQLITIANACGAAFRDRLPAVLQEYSRDAVGCLVADARLLPVFEVAKRLAIPTMALRTSCAACHASFLAYPMLCKKGYLPVQDSQLELPVTELPPYRVSDLMHIGEAGHHVVCQLVARAVATVNISSGVILNTFDVLERRELEGLRRDTAVPVFDIGPLHKFSLAGDSSLLPQDRRCLQWLDTQRPESVLYVSFGSVAWMSPRDLTETAWGIADSGVPFLWVVRPGLARGCAPEASQLPEGFDAATRGRGMVVPWAPQEEVLRHRAVGGWNSTTESVCEGVPMLCRPYFADQTGNTRYVEHVWKVGLELRGELERGSIEAAIHRLMTDKNGAEMRARAGELKKAAADCTGKTGSSRMAIDKMVAYIMSL